MDRLLAVSASLRNSLKKLSDALQPSAREAMGSWRIRFLQPGISSRPRRSHIKVSRKNFGRSVKIKPPGMFVCIVCRKAKRAGGRLYEFPTCPTMLSQACLCGRIEEKKPLSVRVHRCDFRLLPLQRELFYAFLARFASGNGLDAHHIKMACGRVRNRFCLRRPLPSPTASGASERAVYRRGTPAVIENAHVVAVGFSSKREGRKD